VFQLRKTSRDDRNCRPLRFGSARAFTIVEIMVAATVLALSVSSSVIVIEEAIHAVDTARVTTLAGHVLQTQMEKLRLLTWAQLTSPGDGPVAYTAFTPDISDATSAQLSRFTVASEKGKCLQSITDAPSPFGSSMKVITLTATWNGLDGRSHSVSYTSQYAQNGLSDFFYSRH
jgi:type II secretory pathway pseudopilin PulG